MVTNNVLERDFRYCCPTLLLIMKRDLMLGNVSFQPIDKAVPSDPIAPAESIEYCGDEIYGDDPKMHHNLEKHLRQFMDKLGQLIIIIGQFCY